MKTSITLLVFVLLLSVNDNLQAQNVRKVKSSNSKKDSKITLSPYLLPRVDFIQHNSPVIEMNNPNLGVAAGLLFRLTFNQKFGVFTGAGIGKRQFNYTALGNTTWNGESTGTYSWNTEFKHEKLLAEVQAGFSWQHNFKKKNKASCAQFDKSCTGWFFLADIGILIAPEFRNEIFARGSYSRFANNSEGELIESLSYPNWTQESSPTNNNETQIAIILRPSIKYQFKNVAIVAGPEANLGLSNHKDLLNYRSNSNYKVHSLGLFLAAEF